MTLLGRVGADAELRGTEMNPVVTFTLATNERFGSSAGMSVVVGTNGTSSELLAWFT